MVHDVPEIPLVVSDKIQEYTKTKQAVIFLHRIKAWTDIQKVFFILTNLKDIVAFQIR